MPSSSNFYHDPLRRRLLEAMVLSPLLFSLPTGAAELPDITRIVALEWLPVELLNALGVMPLAVADIHNYNQWVQHPRLPQSVIDVGQRTEPNLELLQQIKPSLLLLSKGYGPTPQKLQPIGPTMAFAFNDGSGKPLDVAKSSLQQLATRIGLEARARQHLHLFETFLQDARSRLQGYRQQPLLLFSLLDTRHALVIGHNSLFQAVMERLDIENAWQEDANFWGTSVIGIERLMAIKNARAIYLDHGNQAMMDKVSTSPLWQALPFVRQGQLRRMPAVWFYGATLSAMRFCHLLAQAQEGKP